MSRPPLLPLLLLIALPALLSAAVEDFEGAPTSEVYQGGQRGAGSAVEAIPGAPSGVAVGRSLVLRLAEKHAGFQEIYLKPAKPIPGPGTLVLRARVVGAVPVWTVSARILDAKGEMFSFVSPVLKLGEAWSEVRIPLVDDGTQAHWGGNPGSGRFSGTLVLAGLAANVGEDAATGELWIDDITFAAAKP